MPAIETSAASVVHPTQPACAIDIAAAYVSAARRSSAPSSRCGKIQSSVSCADENHAMDSDALK